MYRVVIEIRSRKRRYQHTGGRKPVTIGTYPNRWVAEEIAAENARQPFVLATRVEEVGMVSVVAK